MALRARHPSRRTLASESRSARSSSASRRCQSSSACRACGPMRKPCAAGLLNPKPNKLVGFFDILVGFFIVDVSKSIHPSQCIRVSPSASESIPPKQSTQVNPSGSTSPIPSISIRVDPARLQSKRPRTGVGAAQSICVHLSESIHLV